jgi:hypothetical protein
MSDDFATGPQHLRASEEWRAEFEQLLPKIETSARFTLRQYGWRGEKLDEGIAEATALAFQGFVSMKTRGVETTDKIGPLARFSAKQVVGGRHLAGQERSKDAMSVVAHRNGGFTTQAFPEHDSTAGENPGLDALIAKRESPAEAAAFRMDASTWLERMPPRKRAVVESMMEGHTGKELAAMHGMSEGRVSQIRSEAAEEWAERCEPCGTGRSR